MYIHIYDHGNLEFVDYNSPPGPEISNTASSNLIHYYQVYHYQV